MKLPPGCEPDCPGCAYRELSTEESRARKDAFSARELKGFPLAGIAEPQQRWGYRRKALLHARLREFGWQLGMIRWRGREEEFIGIPQCPIHAPGINEIFAWVAAAMPRNLPFVFLMVSGKALTIVLKSARKPEWAELFRTWESKMPPGWSLFVNWNPSAGRRVLDAKRTEPIFGSEWLQEGGLWHGPVAFRQQIAQVEEAALRAGVEFLRGANLSTTVDLYCGLGASLKQWQDLGWDAVGVELSGESLFVAARNAPKAKLLRGRVEDRLPQVEEFVESRPFVLYTNPPRDGQGPEVTDWILRCVPARIAYLSCNPRSLGRDLRLLQEKYRVEIVRPFDFFPQTPHVEALALLELL
jgi:23S rRNA (uracil1939-C5)-methyltransferase